MPYMLLEKSAHDFSLPFPPSRRKGLMTVEKSALDLVLLYWCCALRSKHEKIFGNIVRQLNLRSSSCFLEVTPGAVHAEESDG